MDYIRMKGKTMVTVNVGDTFGRWTVIDEGFKGENHHMHYLCRCSCDKRTEKYVDVHRLLNGSSKSCGCLKSELTSSRRMKHGEAGTRLYHIWLGMKARCNNPNNNRYESYGGRGIQLCEEWNNDYTVFREWAYANGYNENIIDCSIDRIDNDKGYYPQNCRWATNKEQCNNRRSNVVIEHNGIKKSATQWSEELGMDLYTILRRYKAGKPIDKKLITPKKDSLTIEYNGEIHTIREWSEKSGIKRTTIIERYKKGMPLEDVFYQGNLFDKRKEVV